MLKKHPKHQRRSMLTALYLSPTIRPDYTRKPYHRTLPLYQTAPKNHTTVTTPYHKTLPLYHTVSQSRTSKLYKLVSFPWRWFKPLPPFTILILVMILFKSQQTSKNTKYEGQHFPQIAGDDFSICDSWNKSRNKNVKIKIYHMSYDI